MSSVDREGIWTYFVEECEVAKEWFKDLGRDRQEKLIRSDGLYMENERA